jgi:polycystin 1L2
MSILNIPFCDLDFSNSLEETQNFGFGWTDYNESFIPKNGLPYIYNSFQYRNASELNSMSASGIYDSYPGGGYIYQARGAEKFLIGNLTILEKLGWIDRNTRAVFGEYAAYNPNINLFIVATIVFEFLPSGTILAKARFDPLDLFHGINGSSMFIIICDVLYIIFIVWFFVKQIRDIIIKRRNYIGFWAFVEWGIIVSSCFAIGIYIYRYTVAVDLLDFFKKTSGYQYIKLQKVSMWSQWFETCVGFCAFLGTLKFMRLLRFNTKMNYLAITLSIAAHDLAGFGVVFVIVWMAFVQIMFLIFYRSLVGYSTIIKAAETSFQIMVGKFDAQSLFNANKFLGSLIFASYNFTIIFFMLNIFLSIIGVAFEVTREREKNDSKEYNLMDYISLRLRKLFGFNIDHELKEERHEKVNQNRRYLDYVYFFPDVVDELAFKLTTVKTTKNSSFIVLFVLFNCFFLLKVV